MWAVCGFLSFGFPPTTESGFDFIFLLGLTGSRLFNLSRTNMMDVYEGLAVAPLMVTQAFVPNIVASKLKQVCVRGGQALLGAFIYELMHIGTAACSHQTGD